MCLGFARGLLGFDLGVNLGVNLGSLCFHLSSIWDSIFGPFASI